MMEKMKAAAALCALALLVSACHGMVIKQDGAQYEQQISAPVEEVKVNPNLSTPAVPLEVDRHGNVIVPDWCASWFDGCNSCSTRGGQAICTQRACVGVPAQPYCKSRKAQ